MNWLGSLYVDEEAVLSRLGDEGVLGFGWEDDPQLTTRLAELLLSSATRLNNKLGDCAESESQLRDQDRGRYGICL